jgi:RNA polymerase sigma-70 factor (ECF subfamily)
MPLRQDLSDTALLQLMAAGDDQAMALFYDRYKGQVYSLVLHVLGDRGTAEEATLDVFMTIWREAGGYRAELASVRTWMVTVARHRAIDLLRRRKARGDQDTAKWVEDALEVLPDPSGDAEAVVGERELRRLVRAALADLPAAQREMLRLAYFRGYSHSEIARTLGQPLGSVKTRIRSALLHLRERLGRL